MTGKNDTQLLLLSLLLTMGLLGGGAWLITNEAYLLLGGCTFKRCLNSSFCCE
jgi:hypothetical protein